MTSSRADSYPLRRRDVVAGLLAERGDALVIAGLGAPSWDVTAAGDTGLNFPLWGAMGAAVPMGLGLAVARPERRVLVITGDGEMLMGLGSLAAAGVVAPANLSVVVLDNERYGETGMQPTHTAGALDLAAVAAAAGWPVTGTIDDQAGLDAARPVILEGAGPVFYAIKVRAETPPLVLPPTDGRHLKERFREALLGEA